MGNELLKKIAGALLICQEVKLQVLMDSQKDKPLEPLLAMYENLVQQFIFSTGFPKDCTGNP